jgi:hypothetical protein
MRLVSGKTVESYMSIRGAGSPSVYTIELEENEEIIICSSYSRFILRHQFRNLRRHTQQHPLRRINEDCSLSDLATSFYWTLWHLTIPFAQEVFLILSG